MEKMRKKEEKKEKKKKGKNNKKKGGKKGFQFKIRRKKLQTKSRKNIRFEGILRRAGVRCSEHGAAAWPGGNDSTGPRVPGCVRSVPDFSPPQAKIFFEERILRKF